MDDLVHFVKDLLELEKEKKRAKDPNFKKKMTCQSLKPNTEMRDDDLDLRRPQNKCTPTTQQTSVKFMWYHVKWTDFVKPFFDKRE